MRNFRLLLACASFSTLVIGLVACGDDDGTGGGSSSGTSGTSGTSGNTGTSGGTSGGTSSGGTSGGTSSGNPAKPTAAATAPAVYIGQTAALDGSGSTGTGLAYAWTLTPPATSKLTTASLEGPTTAKPTFVPDVIGTYTANLTVTAGGQTATATATVNVVDPTVFYLTETNHNDGLGLSTATVSVSGVTASDGGAGNAINCFARDGGAGSSYATQTTYTGEIWSDVWEAPAGQPSKMVYMFVTEEDGGKTSAFLSTDANATCATPPKVLDAHPGDPSATGAFEIPRISADGTRVLYTTTNAAGQTHMTTIGLDGTAKHDIAPRGSYGDGGSDPDGGRYTKDTTPGPRPAWIDATHVAWLQLLDGNKWQIVKASDADNQVPEVLMTCGTLVPNQFDLLPSGEVIVSQTIKEADANATATQLAAYTPGADKACGEPRKITKLVSASGSSSARSFSLSPDKKRVAWFQETDGTNGEMAVNVGNVDGSGEPIRLGIASSNIYGPRWVGGGTAVVWGVAGARVDAGTHVSNSVVYANAASDAGEKLVASVPTGTTLSTVNNSSACGIGYGFGSAASGVGFLGLLGLGATRRRRAKR